MFSSGLLAVILAFSLHAGLTSERAALGVTNDTPEFTSFVDPLIGTAQSPTFDPTQSVHGGGGNVFPGAVLPFGMVSFGPDTAQPGRLAYAYESQSIRGFSFTHLSGAGCIVSDELLGLPLIKSGALTDAPVAFNHAQEKASPGFYEVTLANGVKFDLTATTRSGFAQIQFPTRPTPSPVEISVQAPSQSASSSMTGDPSTAPAQAGSLHVIDKSRIGGWVQGGNFCNVGDKYVVYYAIEFDSPMESSVISPDGISLQFAPLQPTLQLKVGLSYVSEKNAWANLAAENPGWSFSEVRAAADSTWNQALAKIALTGTSASDASDRTVFYTALYHSLLHPNVFSDVAGEYIGFDRNVHVTSPSNRVQYANFSAWDTYRTQSQLLAVLFPDRTSDMIESLLNDAAQCGGLPRWPYNNDETAIMVGDPAAILIANAYAFGAQGFDLNKALALVKKGGTDPTTACNGHLTRPSLSAYLKLGYVPESGTSVTNGSAATTLEYNAADFAIAQYAHALGDTQTEKDFRSRAEGWKKLFDPKTGYLRPKDENGAWLSGFTPSSGTGFVEGNAAQYTWDVPFDFPDLVNLLGGPAATEARLDVYLSQLNVGENHPYFWGGNEPGFVDPWVYNWAQTSLPPAHTAVALSRILKNLYTTAPGGLPGNDDLGAMSAWVVWSELGLYPLVPGVAGFTLNPPLFSRAELHLDNGNVIRIVSTTTNGTTNGGSKKTTSPGGARTISLPSGPGSTTTLSSPWVSWSELQSAKEIDFNSTDSGN